MAGNHVLFFMLGFTRFYTFSASSLKMWSLSFDKPHSLHKIKVFEFIFDNLKVLVLNWSQWFAAKTCDRKEFWVSKRDRRWIFGQNRSKMDDFVFLCLIFTTFTICTGKCFCFRSVSVGHYINSCIIEAVCI